MKINKIKYSIFFIIVIFSFSFITSCKPAKAIQNEPIKDKIEEKNTFEDSPKKVEEVKEETIEEASSKEENQDSDIVEIKCVRVVNGDTIEVEDETGIKYIVRYMGIDTPETYEYYGDIATKKNAELVLGKIVTLIKDVSEVNRYRIILAYVYIEDIFVNAYLVQEGYAQVCTISSDLKYAYYFQKLQQEAQKSGKGLWSIEVAEEEEEKQQQTDQTQEEEQQQTDQTQEEEQQTYSIEVVSLTSPISIGAQSSITIKTVPNVHCTIVICNADSICIMAKGLEPKDSDGNGNCTWSWNVESGTILGDWKIVIVAEGVGQTETHFTVIE